MGWITIIDGFLHFQGVRTEFSLLGCDTNFGSLTWRSLLAKLAPHQELPDKIGFSLQWFESRVEQVANFRFLGENSANDKFFAKEIQEDLLRWKTLSRPEQKISTFPPNFATSDSVETARRIGRVRMVVGVLLVFSTIPLLFAFPGASEAQLYWYFAIILLPVIGVSLIRSGLRARNEVWSIPLNVLAGRNR